MIERSLVHAIEKIKPPRVSHGDQVQISPSILNGTGDEFIPKASRNTLMTRQNPELWASKSDEPATILTAMENRVLTLVTLAKTNKEIARALGISPATVKRHIENLLRKLKLRNRVEAAVYGLMIKGCPSRNRSACALEIWRNWRKPDYENGPIDP
jgi:DNA-binding NarL/FixJ family response regulator